MKRAVIYTRVSTVGQHLETQFLDPRQMASQRGLERMPGLSCATPDHALTIDESVMIPFSE